MLLNKSLDKMAKYFLIENVAFYTYEKMSYVLQT